MKFMRFSIIFSENRSRMTKFVLYSVSLYCLVLIARCHGEMMIMNSPRAITFEGSDEMKLSRLKNVISTAMGYTVDTDDEWNNMKVEQPFGVAKAVFVVHFPGIDTFNSSGSNNIYSIMPDEDMEETWNALVKKTEQRFPNEHLELKKVILNEKPEVYAYQKEPYVIDVSSNGPFESISSSQPNSENDKLFIEEMNKLHSVTNELLSKANKNSKPHIFWVTATNMGQIIASRKGDSINILNAMLSTMNNEIRKPYNNDVLFIAMTDGEDSKKRLKRETTAGTQPTLISLNVAEDYDEDFPVIFNIVFWFSLAMLFAVIAICLVIGRMDPGRDSIIYRMTSTRMKKDN